GSKDVCTRRRGHRRRWNGSRAQQFVEDHFREEGYDEDSIYIARQAATLLAGALITALMEQILQLIATHLTH
ncbi:hypothetical protein, partial [Klebsiella pneumoniae]